MPTFETMPPEVHFQIFSYLSTATLGPNFFPHLLTSAVGPPHLSWSTIGRWRPRTHTPWNRIGTHPFQHLSASSKALRNAVKAYCEHRLQHLLTARPPGKGPKTPFPSPYCRYYLRYMAERCTFCYTMVTSEGYGGVEFTIPVCRECKVKFPLTRMLTWEHVEAEYELSLEELKTNCEWAPIEETIYPTEREYDWERRELYQSRKTYVFNHGDIQRYIKRRYGGLDVFFALLEKKEWDKNLELERMAKQCRWAREEIERRMTAGEAIVEQYIAEHEEMEKERPAKQKMCDELVARTGRREEMFHGLMKTFLDETAGPEGCCDQTCESDMENLDKPADRAVSELLYWKRNLHDYLKARVARERLIQQFRRHMKDQVTADVLRYYGLDSLVEPPMPIKRFRRYDCRGRM
jgi:hypothetical protein